MKYGGNLQAPSGSLGCDKVGNVFGCLCLYEYMPFFHVMLLLRPNT